MNSMVCHAYNSYCDFNDCRCREEQVNKCYVIYSVSCNALKLAAQLMLPPEFIQCNYPFPHNKVFRP